MQLVIDASATAAQAAALTAIAFADDGGLPFEIFSAVCPHKREPLRAAITVESDREHRTATIRIPALGEVRIAPIENPVTGEAHRARIVLPDGFEFKEAEVGDAVLLRAASTPPLAFEHQHTHAHLNRFDWTNQG